MGPMTSWSKWASRSAPSLSEKCGGSNLLGEGRRSLIQRAEWSLVGDNFAGWPGSFCRLMSYGVAQGVEYEHGCRAFR